MVKTATVKEIKLDQVQLPTSKPNPSELSSVMVMFRHYTWQYSVSATSQDWIIKLEELMIQFLWNS